MGDTGALPATLPVFLTPDIPLNVETLTIIIFYATAVAVMGLLESLMTDRHAVRLESGCVVTALPNTAAGFIGGLAGCTMIGNRSST